MKLHGFAPYGEKPRRFRTLPLSFLLTTVIGLTIIQVPVFYPSAIEILSTHRNGAFLSTSVRLHQEIYFGTGYLNGSTISVTGVFNSHGIPQLGFCWEMAPMASNDQPLRIPQCGGGGGINCFGLCPIANSWVTTNANICNTPYTGGCVPAFHMYLDPITAIDGSSALLLITILMGLAGAILVNPLLLTATAIAGMTYYSYSTLYGGDANPDKSFDLTVPWDFTNALMAVSGAPDGAMPHYWWKISGYTYIIQGRN